MLFDGSADVLVMDINIFKYYRQAVKDRDVSAEVVFAPLFHPTDYRVAFSSAEVCRKFNEGLTKLKASGAYNAIIKSYIK